MRCDVPESSYSTPWARNRIRLCAGLLYFIAAVTTLQFTSNGHDVAPVWPANAVLLALLLSARRPRWRDVLGPGLIANLAANLLTRGALWGPLLYGLCNLCEVMIATLLLRRVVGASGLLSTPATVRRFILAAGIIAPCVSALGGATTAWLIFDQSFGRSFETWLLADALGLLLVTPFLLAVFNGDYLRSLREKNWTERAELLALQMLTAVVAYLAFFVAERPMLFVLFPPVMLVTFRLGRLGAKLSVLLVAIIGAIGTMHDLGPIADIAHNKAEQAQFLQVYLAVLLLTSLPVAAGLSSRTALTADLVQRERRLRQREAELSRLVGTDSLTGLLNRSAFREHAASLLEEGRKRPLCLVALDLDHFKAVNDRWGHPAGDAALVHLASVVRSQLRAGDVAGRLGGDEFMLLLPETTIHEAEAITMELSRALKARPLRLADGTLVPLSMSCGICPSRPGMAFDAMAGTADMALYQAKAAGRDCVRLAA